MFTGNYRRATWGICEPVRGNFLLRFFFFFVKSEDMWDLRDFTCCRHRIALTSHGFRVCLWLQCVYCFIALVPRLAPTFSEAAVSLRRRLKHSASILYVALSNVIMQHAYGFVQTETDDDDDNNYDNNQGVVLLNDCQWLYKHCKSHTVH